MPLVYHNTDIYNTEISVWEATESRAFFERQCLLTTEDKKFLDRIHPRKALEWTASRALLRRMAGSESPFMYEHDHLGKPFLANDPREISISHSHGTVAVIISDVEVGIDVQLKSDKVLYISSKFLGPHELDVTSRNSDPNLVHLTWSTKEALFKTYAKGSVDFRKHLFVDLPESIESSGEISGRIIKPGERIECRINYSFIDQYTLVYAIRKME